MKSFSQYITEKFGTSDFLTEGFADKQAEVISLYKEIKSARDALATKEEKNEKTKEFAPAFKKALEDCIKASIKERKFFTDNQETHLRTLAGILGLGERYTNYLSMSQASEEEIESWENEISLEAAGVKDSDSEEEEDEETKSEKEESSSDAEDEMVDDDDHAGYQGLGKIKEVDDKEVDSFIKKNSSKDAVTKITKKVIVIVDEQVGDEPDRGFIGETSLVEHSILAITNEEDAKSVILNGKAFKTPKDFIKKLKAYKESGSVKVFFFDKTSAERDEDPWTIKTF